MHRYVVIGTFSHAVILCAPLSKGLLLYSTQQNTLSSQHWSKKHRHKMYACNSRFEHASILYIPNVNTIIRYWLIWQLGLTHLTHSLWLSHEYEYQWAQVSDISASLASREAGWENLRNLVSAWMSSTFLSDLWLPYHQPLCNLPPDLLS